VLAKHAHWNVAGPTFTALHALLADIADVARDAADRVAERSATIGHYPDGRVSTIARDSVLPGLDAGSIGDRDVIAEFKNVLETVTARLRGAITVTGNDPVTQDLITETTADIEKRAWIVRSHQ
jgi:starvation-inducible DNA-binding protein